MPSRPARLCLAVLLAFGVAAGAHAQSAKKPAQTAVVPVFYNNKVTDKPDAFLLLQPTNSQQAGARWRFGGNSALDAAFGLDAGDSLALLCNRNTGLSALTSLSNNCAIGAVGDAADGSSRHGSATAAYTHGGSRVGATIGAGRANLPAWLAPGGNRVTGDVDINDLTIFAQKKIGREGVVSIAGTTANARLVPASELPADLADRWNTKSLTLSGGYGNFSASVIGRVVDTPGQQKWEGVGLGLTWRTPWSGQLTVGADNLVTRGKNPFSPNSATTQDDGAVPYVRYEQDL